MKEFFPEEPMELVGMPVPGGDDLHMAECLVEEYLLLGWNERQLMRLFTQPFFCVTYKLYRDQGEDYVRALIQRIGDEWNRGHLMGDDIHA